MPNNKKKSARRSPASGGKNPGATPAPLSLWQRFRQGEFKAAFRTALRGESGRFVLGFCILIVSVLLLLSFVSNVFTGHADQAGVQSGDLSHAANWGGALGAYVSYYFMDRCFGIPSIFIPLFTLLLGVRLMGAYQVRLWKWFLNFSLLMIWSSILLSLVTAALPPEAVSAFSYRLGGGHGDFVRDFLVRQIGTFGAWLAVVAVAVFYLLYLTRETIDVVRRIMHPQDYLRKHRKGGDAAADPAAGDDVTDETENGPGNQPLTDEPVLKDSDNAPADGASEDGTVSLDFSVDTPAADDVAPLKSSDDGGAAAAPAADKAEAAPAADGTKLDITPTVTDDKATRRTVGEVGELEPYDPRRDLEYYKFPTLSLLKHYDDQGPAIDMAEQNANKERIIKVLRDFGVEISSIKATIGPTITLYEVTPAPGVRINKIRNLEDDIALSLSAIGIRIIAPMPGKGTIGIEVPNKRPRIVSMESIINTRKFQESTFELPIALGKTITNEVFMVDLAKMPHLLVAGATGQGKSVGLNAIITSLLYKKHPAELKFVMVDPKKVEFSVYAPIEKHFLAKIPGEDDPIITDVTKVVQTLKSLCQLMDHRYDLLKKARARNIKEYNAKFKARQLNPANGHEFMPYIVVIIDEFGDLIMTAGKEVELPIARIAQLARAVGMHMVIATQRPTTNIITGTIKANFPARMAFKVMSQIDSRTILDQGGANQLVGKGDMLFLAGNMPERVQCAFVDTPEVERINDFISEQQGYLSAFELPEPEMDDDEGGGSKGELDAGSIDPMFEEAARLIVVHQQGSTSLIQRKFSIGYNRAGRLMDQLERAGIVGPVRGSKPREVLCQTEADLEAKIAALHGE